MPARLVQSLDYGFGFLGGLCHGTHPVMILSS
jgi:hypothetical protein